MGPVGGKCYFSIKGLQQNVTWTNGILQRNRDDFGDVGIMYAFGML